MNNIHKFLIDYIRDRAEKDQGELSNRFKAWTDDHMIRTMFLNFRGQRGLRLTKFGLEIMKLYFRGCEISIPNGVAPSARELLYLDSNASLPYYCTMNGYVFFDLQLGTMVAVAGSIQTLIDIGD